MSQIITFYSFKGGVGRTMALANVACAIAAKGREVLIVDWDLEAPGLHHYFAAHAKHTPSRTGGTIGLLESMAKNQDADSSAFERVVTVPKTKFFRGCQFTLLDSGLGSDEYERRVLNFDLEGFYRERNGAFKLETLRQTWRDRFDFVLIDSRTGITDTGGICTIFLPDVLALVFTANEQSLAGGIDVAHRAQKGRQALSFDRRGLTIFPIPSRFDSRTEQEEADLWMKRFSDELSPFLAAWCPREVAPRNLLERIKIPHVPYFSFGEKLPVVTHTQTDPDLPGFYYQNIAGILEGQFAEDAVLSACGIARRIRNDARSTRHAPNKSVYLSYRRDATGKSFARSIKEALTKYGYDVFLDVDSIDAGEWATKILTEVSKRAHFILLLTPGALDRCEQEDDWIRQEFLAAVNSARNIVPVREESVDWRQLRASCPERMKMLFDLQIATVHHAGFSQDIETLVRSYIPQ